MRYGLLALSILMLTGGGVAAQSALAISNSAQARPAAEPKIEAAQDAIAYGALPFTAARSRPTRIAAR